MVLLGDLDRYLILAVCLLDPAVWPLDPAVWPLDPAVWPLDPAVWPLDPAVPPLDHLICGCGSCGFWFVHGGKQCRGGSAIVEVSRCLCLDVWLRLCGLVLVGWLSLCLWHVGDLVARPCHRRGEVVVCVVCRLGVASVMSAFVVPVDWLTWRW